MLNVCWSHLRVSERDSVGEWGLGSSAQSDVGWDLCWEHSECI